MPCWTSCATGCCFFSRQSYTKSGWWDAVAGSGQPQLSAAVHCYRTSQYLIKWMQASRPTSRGRLAYHCIRLQRIGQEDTFQADPPVTAIQRGSYTPLGLSHAVARAVYKAFQAGSSSTPWLQQLVCTRTAMRQLCLTRGAHEYSNSPAYVASALGERCLLNSVIRSRPTCGASAPCSCTAAPAIATRRTAQALLARYRHATFLWARSCCTPGPEQCCPLWPSTAITCCVLCMKRDRLSRITARQQWSQDMRVAGCTCGLRLHKAD